MASPPEISVEEGDISRRTLTEVRDDLRGTPWPRAPLMTISYHDVPLDAAHPDDAQGRAPTASAPDIEMSESPFDPSMIAGGSMPSIDVRAGSMPMIEIDGAPLGSAAQRSSMPSIQVTTSSLPSIDLSAIEDDEELAERDTMVPQTSAMGSLPTTPTSASTGSSRGVLSVERSRGATRASSSVPPPQNQPAAPAQPGGRRSGSAVASAARRTLASADKPAAEAVRRASAEDRAPACDALELKTYVVPETELNARSSDAQRRKFVAERLGRYLPCEPSRVRRIDVKLFEPGAVMLRVWCPID
ncbi:MAG: hypothetical protein U0165_08415 [Polyangiaceae bacterium]